MQRYGIWCTEMTKIIDPAATYHLNTSYQRHKLGGHMMDWEHQPSTTKPYKNLKTIPLDKQATLPEALFHQVMTGQVDENMGNGEMDLPLISTLLTLSYAFTAQTRHMGKPFYYRSAASAGALYPCEIYVASHGKVPLAEGIYHYNMFDFSLETIRTGKINQWIPADRSGKEGLSPALSFFITAIFFRSSWKYRSRAYRYVLLDTGHLMANMVQAVSLLGLEGKATLDFDDNAMDRLLSVDPEKEVCLGLINLYHKTGETGVKTTGDATLPPTPDLEIQRASTVSSKEVSYREILDIHFAGNPATPFEPDHQTPLSIPVSKWLPVKKTQMPPDNTYVDVLWKRRSKRNYVPQPFPASSFMALLDLLCDHFSGDMKNKFSDGIFTGMLINNVQGILPGFYLLDPGERKYGPVFEADLANQMAAACLDQMWLSNAAVHFLFIADVDTLNQRYGPRGYRYAMIQAGRLGQIIYLGATDLGAGACGIGAIYDSEAENLLDLDDHLKLLYLVAAGPVKR